MTPVPHRQPLRVPQFVSCRGIVSEHYARSGELFTSTYAENKSLTARRSFTSPCSVSHLLDWQMDSVDVHAVFPAGRATKAAARALAEHVVAAFRD
jgi:hypothetical protein